MARTVKALELLEDTVKVGCLTVAGMAVSASALVGGGLIAAGLLLTLKQHLSNPARSAIDKAAKNAVKTAKSQLMIAYGVSEDVDYAVLIEKDDAHRAVIAHLRAALPRREEMVAHAFNPDILAPIMAQRLCERDLDRLPLGDDGAAHSIALTYARKVLAALCAESALLEDAHAQVSVATLARVNQLMDEVKRLRSGTVDFSTAQALARRLPENIGDLNAQVQELLRQLDAAEELKAEGKTPGNVDEFVRAVRERVAEKIKQEDFDGALTEATDSFDHWQAQEAERQEAEIRNGLALLETTISAAVAKGDAEAVARAEVRRVDLDIQRAEPKLSLTVALKSYRDVALSHGARLDHEVSILLARALLGAADTADERGAALNWLGVMLSDLGERESGTARLEEAVTAFSDALKDCTRERVPLKWAVIQNNLGEALRVLGERKSGTARLEEAVTAFSNALTEYTRERVPLGWATTQNNLGNALQTLGERESGTARLEEAVTAFSNALTEYTRERERVPLDWAMTQNNLGNALQILGARESGTARLEEAVTAFSNALTEYTRERVPLDWAMTQNNLGAALSALGERESGTARLEEAVTAFSNALQERTRERVPLDWAMTQNNLGQALVLIADRSEGSEGLAEAVSAFTGALEVYQGAEVEWDLSDVREDLARAEALLAERGAGGSG